MYHAFADRVCRDLRGAERRQPFGPDTVVWTVEGHMFAAYTVDGRGLSLRLDQDLAVRLLDEGLALSEPDLAGAGWVLLPWETHPDMLRRHIEVSYRLVRADGNAHAGA